MKKDNNGTENDNSWCKTTHFITPYLQTPCPLPQLSYKSMIKNIILGTFSRKQFYKEKRLFLNISAFCRVTDRPTE